MVQNWTSPVSLITSCFSARNEALHAFSIQEVTSLADSYDSPLICADMEVSIKKEFLITQHTGMQTDETYLYMLYVKQYLLNHIKWLIESESKIIHLPKPSSMGSSTSESVTCKPKNLRKNIQSPMNFEALRESPWKQVA